MNNEQLIINNSQVLEGYKQTEVGVIPENWEVIPLKVISRVNQGLQIAIEERLNHPTEKSKRYITIQAINSGEFTEYIESYSPSVCCTENDVLMTRTGNTGIIVTGISGVFHNNFFKVDFDRDKLNKDFFVYYLRTETTQKIILEKAGTSTIPDLNHNDFYSIEIVLPPIEEQQAIATTLSDIDALIAKLDKLIAKKRHLKTATMQQLLTGKKRLPGFGESINNEQLIINNSQVPEGYKQTGVGVIPEDWDVRILGSLASIQRGASPRPIDNPVWFDRNSLVGWVRVSDVTRSGIYLQETKQKLSPLGIQHSRSVSKGSLIMSICATVGRPIITEIDVCIHDGFVVLDNLKTEQLFMYYILKWLEPSWSKQGQTGSQMTLNTELINSTAVYLPSTLEQRAIATVLSDIDTEITALETRRTKTQAIKQGMMQELLTGRTRLINNE